MKTEQKSHNTRPTTLKPGKIRIYTNKHVHHTNSFQTDTTNSLSQHSHRLLCACTYPTTMNNNRDPRFHPLKFRGTLCIPVLALVAVGIVVVVVITADTANKVNSLVKKVDTLVSDDDELALMTRHLLEDEGVQEAISKLVGGMLLGGGGGMFSKRQYAGHDSVNFSSKRQTLSQIELEGLELDSRALSDDEHRGSEDRRRISEHFAAMLRDERHLHCNGVESRRICRKIARVCQGVSNCADQQDLETCRNVLVQSFDLCDAIFEDSSARMTRPCEGVEDRRVCRKIDNICKGVSDCAYEQDMEVCRNVLIQSIDLCRAVLPQ